MPPLATVAATATPPVSTIWVPITVVALATPPEEMVCVPLDGGVGVLETWELVNLTSEDHNFHIHQTRFYLLAGGTSPGTTSPSTLGQELVRTSSPSEETHDGQGVCPRKPEKGRRRAIRAGTSVLRGRNLYRASRVYLDSPFASPTRSPPCSPSPWSASVIRSATRR